MQLGSQRNATGLHNASNVIKHLPLSKCTSTPTRTARRASGQTQASISNDLGVHALVYSGSWSKQDATAAVLGAARCGYKFIEIPLLEPATVDAAMTRSILDDHGITASASLGLSLDADISSDDNNVAKAGEALLMQALAASGGFGSKYMCGILYSALAKYDRPPTASGRANCVAALKRVANAAANDYNIQLGLEVVNRYETNVVNTATQAMELLDEVNEENIFIHLDTYHMHIEEPSMAAAVYTAGDKLGYVHLGESHRGYLGSGNVNFTEFFRALAEIEYGGPIVFESFSNKVVNPKLSNTLAVWRNFFCFLPALGRISVVSVGSLYCCICLLVCRRHKLIKQP